MRRVAFAGNTTAGAAKSAKRTYAFLGHGTYAEAEAQQTARGHRGPRERLLGAERPENLATADDLACSLSDQRRYVEAEAINRELLEVRKRVLGGEHADTLATARNLALSLSGQGRYADAEQIERELLGAQERVLGAEHPNTVRTAGNLATSVAYQGRYAEAEGILQAALASCDRALGPTHPLLLGLQASLENVRGDLHAERPLPAGTRLRVLSFDERAGRYAVALDDGKELSLKAECMTRAGCAVVGTLAQ